MILLFAFVVFSPTFSSFTSIGEVAQRSFAGKESPINLQKSERRKVDQSCRSCTVPSACDYNLYDCETYCGFSFNPNNGVCSYNVNYCSSCYDPRNCDNFEYGCEEYCGFVYNQATGICERGNEVFNEPVTQAVDIQIGVTVTVGIMCFFAVIVVFFFTCIVAYTLSQKGAGAGGSEISIEVPAAAANNMDHQLQQPPPVAGGDGVVANNQPVYIAPGQDHQRIMGADPQPPPPDQSQQPQLAQEIHIPQLQPPGGPVQVVQGGAVQYQQQALPPPRRSSLRVEAPVPGVAAAQQQHVHGQPVPGQNDANFVYKPLLGNNLLGKYWDWYYGDGYYRKRFCCIKWSYKLFCGALVPWLQLWWYWARVEKKLGSFRNTEGQWWRDRIWKYHIKYTIWHSVLCNICPGLVPILWCWNSSERKKNFGEAFDQRFPGDMV